MAVGKPGVPYFTAVKVVPLAGGGAESVMEPSWRPDGALYFMSDRSGFWNLYVRRDGETRAILAKDAEFAGPLWGLGQRVYFLHDGRTSNLVQAIGAHASQGSEANGVIQRFNALNASRQQDVLNFLRSL